MIKINNFFSKDNNFFGGSVISGGDVIINGNVVGGKFYNVIEGNGELTTIKKDVMEKFYKIKSSIGKIRFHLVKYELPKLSITVDKNLEEYLRIGVDHGVLDIGVKRGNYSFTKCDIDVYSDIISNISLCGSAGFEFLDNYYIPNFIIDMTGSSSFIGSVCCDFLNVVMCGSSEINIKGSCSNNSYINMSGSSSFNGEDFFTKESHININGSGSVDISVKYKLFANVYGSGKVKYGGNPEHVHANVYGSGKIKKRK